MALGLADSESAVVGAMEDVIDGAYDAASKFSPTMSVDASGVGGGYGQVSNYNFNGITINAQDRSMDDVFRELVSYANRARVMGVA